MITATLAAFLVFAVVCLVHLVVFHFFRIHGVVRAIQIIVVLCSPLLYPAYRLLEPLGLDGLLPLRIQIALGAGFLFCFAAYFYVTTYFAIAMSITLESLASFSRTGRDAVAVSELNEAFPFRRVIEARLREMEKMGLATRTGEGENAVYQATPRCMAMGARVRAIKGFMNLGKGG